MTKTGKVIAIANHKGGVAKTATTHNLGKALAMANQKVLLIDMDAQGNLSQNMGQNDPEATLYNLFVDDVLPIVSVDENLDLIPSDLDLDFADEKLRALGLPGYRALAMHLAKLKKTYDFILLDCPPSVRGMIVSNAMVAADSVLIPVVPEKGAVKGLSGVFRLMEDNAIMNENIKVEGIVFTRVKDRTALHSHYVGEIKEEYSHVHIFDSIIHESIVVAEAGTMEVDIFSHAPKNKAAQNYLSLAEELLNHG
ncbi:ParA family protein [Persicobacter psychrovividus]|uniref:Sporulation initiation inhibitor Soj n=1 Tax=Persicobacter psychrovividus TaxID=387638 RepID=A0ABM7VMM7_9BACT|nr:sporulation initiation inhibitor Soj [Persicobacter psychrovividus]